jgi:hypothetical protein
MRKYVVQKQSAGHDNNGNPRRMVVVFNPCDRDYVGYLRIVDSAYMDPAQALESIGIDHRQCLEIPAAHISVKHYRELERIADVLNPALPFQVVYTEDGEHYAYARTERAARRIVANYNRPYRNDENSERVKYVRNDNGGK